MIIDYSVFHDNRKREFSVLVPMVEHYRYYAMGPRARLGGPSTIGGRL